MTVEDILIEAEKLNLREEVIKEATSIRRHKEYITQIQAYEDAYTRVIHKRTSNGGSK